MWYTIFLVLAEVALIGRTSILKMNAVLFAQSFMIGCWRGIDSSSYQAFHYCFKGNPVIVILLL